MKISKVKCDQCPNETDPTLWSSPTYYELILGGSDFEMSIMPPEDRVNHFCSLECLKNWVNSFDEE